MQAKLNAGEAVGNIVQIMDKNTQRNMLGLTCFE